jgi:hypothetical protein
VQATAGQPMILILESPHYDVVLGVYDPNGNELASPSKMWSHWQWQMPMTGLYTIEVVGGYTTENYTLTVKLGQMVHFGSDSDTITLKNYTTSGLVHSYAIHATAGQVLTASLSDSSDAYLDIYGISSGALLSPSDKESSWKGELPDTGIYVIEVVPYNYEEVYYTLTLTIP